MNQDAEHLRLLSIFYYVYAGLVACITCVFALVLLVSLIQLVNPEFLSPDHAKPDDIPEVGFIIFCGGLTLLGALFITYLINVGGCLSRRKRYTSCLVIAGVCCALFPIGTVLGVFSLIVLARSSVKALFDGALIPPMYPR